MYYTTEYHGTLREKQNKTKNHQALGTLPKHKIKREGSDSVLQTSSLARQVSVQQ